MSRVLIPPQLLPATKEQCSVHVPFSVKTTKCAKNYEQYVSIPSAGDDGLPLEDNDLVGVLRLKLADELDKVAVTVLVGAILGQLKENKLFTFCIYTFLGVIFVVDFPRLIKIVKEKVSGYRKIITRISLC